MFFLTREEFKRLEIRAYWQLSHVKSHTSAVMPLYFSWSMETQITMSIRSKTENYLDEDKAFIMVSHRNIAPSYGNLVTVSVITFPGAFWLVSWNSHISRKNNNLCFQRPWQRQMHSTGWHLLFKLKKCYWYNSGNPFSTQWKINLVIGNFCWANIKQKWANFLD